MRRRKRTGAALGTVYAWGMVGSLAGTFLAGFVLIDALGTKGLVLALATLLAIAATTLGSIWHAAWAGIPLGLVSIGVGIEDVHDIIDDLEQGFRTVQLADVQPFIVGA